MFLSSALILGPPETAAGVAGPVFQAGESNQDRREVQGGVPGHHQAVGDGAREVAALHHAAPGREGPADQGHNAAHCQAEKFTNGSDGGGGRQV